MKCLICADVTEGFVDPRNGWDFYHCTACECIFKDPKNFIDATAEVKHYGNHNNTFDSPGYVEMFEGFIEATFAKYINSIETVLEFGSGPGPVLSELLRRKGFTVDSYDKYFAPQKVYEGKTYDLITSTEVIEHIDDPKALFAFFNTHLKEGGYLALMTQFHQNSQSSFLSWWYKNDPTHIVFFRPKSFEVLAEMYGFTVLGHDDKKNLILQKQ